MANKNKFYNGNRNLKKAGVSQKMTPHEQMEFIKCKNDPVYFCKKYVKIIDLDHGLVSFDMWDFQEEMIRAYSDNRFVINLLSRQMGKSLTTVAFCLHTAIFNKHQAIGILANKAATARTILNHARRMYENLPFFLQVGVVKWNEGSIELGNGSTILAESGNSDAVRGYTFNCVTGDTKVTICDDYDRLFLIDISEANSPKYKYIKGYDLWGNMKYYTVYKITNTINNKEYIGYHQTNNLDDGYMGSGKLIKRAISKYGVSSFTKEYIEIFDNMDEAVALEALIVNAEYTLSDTTYNITLGGNVRIMVGKNNPFYNKRHSEETKNTIRLARLNHNKTTDDDLVIDGITYNSIYSAKQQTGLGYTDIKKKLLTYNNGYVSVLRHEKFVADMKHHEECRVVRKLKNGYAQSVRMTKRLKGVPMLETTKRKISNTLMGHKKSEDWVNKINKNPDKIRKTALAHTGMKRSAEAKRKMSAAKKGKSPHNKGKVYCYDPATLVKKLCVASDIPVGWVRGFVPKVEHHA